MARGISAAQLATLIAIVSPLVHVHPASDGTQSTPNFFALVCAIFNIMVVAEIL